MPINIAKQLKIMPLLKMLRFDKKGSTIEKTDNIYIEIFLFKKIKYK